MLSTCCRGDQEGASVDTAGASHVAADGACMLEWAVVCKTHTTEGKVVRSRQRINSRVTPQGAVWLQDGLVSTSELPSDENWQQTAQLKSPSPQPSGCVSPPGIPTRQRQCVLLRGEGTQTPLYQWLSPNTLEVLTTPEDYTL